MLKITSRASAVHKIVGRILQKAPEAMACLRLVQPIERHAVAAHPEDVAHPELDAGRQVEPCHEVGTAVHRRDFLLIATGVVVLAIIAFVVWFLFFAHNPLLRVGRKLTPSARTPDEYPLTGTAVAIERSAWLRHFCWSTISNSLAS